MEVSLLSIKHFQVTDKLTASGALIKIKFHASIINIYLTEPYSTKLT